MLPTLRDCVINTVPERQIFKKLRSEKGAEGGGRVKQTNPTTPVVPRLLFRLADGSLGRETSLESAIFPTYLICITFTFPP